MDLLAAEEIAVEAHGPVEVRDADSEMGESLDFHRVNLPRPIGDRGRIADHFVRSGIDSQPRTVDVEAILAPS